ncbi:MAG: SdpI family protein [Ginsengibacter sp.]
MKNKFLAVILLTLLPFIYLAIIWKSLPLRVPIHFDFKGNIDRYGSKTDVLILTFTMMLLALIIYLLFNYIHIISPKIAAADNRSRMQKIALAVVAFFVIIQFWLLYIIRQGQIGFSIKFVLIAVSILFAIIGNYMPNLQPNYVAGFRLPWTLKNADNWKKTHDVAGRLWFSGGLIAALLCFFLPLKPAVIVMAIIFVILLLYPAIYSYNLYTKARNTL